MTKTVTVTTTLATVAALIGNSHRGSEMTIQVSPTSAFGIRYGDAVASTVTGATAVSSTNGQEIAPGDAKTIRPGRALAVDPTAIALIGIGGSATVAIELVNER